ncbi:hypothetical protein HG535_0B05360 [Zygotorulaspora mrakii]|uniref:Lethal giant larvae (Lgl)-like C-terminal domain-containing protein n=1 Tax=Zygotorulaspora mrakii TaxID=42260 RepID=A0A7H9AZC0_ZYGMR|nr:uncharacterized protein HG535_0B05360 [Zygotorulaspora mrakii]QLG71494.1 hypothetical protein HG535_0B05360 [Zygotorulaspora mrakii]
MFSSRRLKKAFKNDRSKSENERTNPENEPIRNGLSPPVKSPKKFSLKVPELGVKGQYSKLFSVSEVSRYGMNGKVTTSAFNFTQSLLALATDTGEIHVYGQQQVEVVFTLEGKSHIKFLKFVKGIYLVAIDSRDVIMVFSLFSKRMLTSVFSPGKIACVETDPSLDWLMIGLQSGIILFYDVDRNVISNFKIENLQKTRFFPKDRISAVISMQWNPRDIGTVLISYDQVTVTYSLVEADIKQHFIYELLPGAPGGDFLDKQGKLRRPGVKQSLYHPNSLHILTVHEDNSLVFWDANSGQLIQARTLFETDVHISQEGFQKPLITAPPRITQVAWICQKNPEYTSLVVSTQSKEVGQSLTLIELGGTPLYSITSYENMSKYYANTRSQRIVPLSNSAPIIEFLPLPSQSPYFSGCHDPKVILVLLSDGQIETLLYPSSHFSYKASLFSQSLAWVRPTATRSLAVSVPKKLWLGMMSAAKSSDNILKGGEPLKKNVTKSDACSALATGHKDGSVRIWDASRGEISGGSVFEVNLSRILNMTSKAIDNISFSTQTLELAVSIESGDVVLFKFDVNQFYNPNPQKSERELEMNFRRFSINSSKELLVDIRDRSPENIRQGFMPITAVHANKGKVTSLTNSNVGFVGIGYQDGTLLILDRRGPAVIYMQAVDKLPNVHSQYITAIEFVIMEYADDGYSSILMLCGSDTGEVLVYKIIPENGGRFAAHFVESRKTNDEGPITMIDSFSKSQNESCSANISQMRNLSSGLAIPGYVIVSGKKDIRVWKIGKSFESHKSFKYPVAASGLAFIPFVNNGEVKVVTVVIVLLLGGDIKVLSIPDAGEISSMVSTVPIQARFIRDSSVLKNGDILIRTNEFQASLLSTVNEQATGISGNSTLEEKAKTDSLYIPGKKIAYRPQVNSLQWARGTINCTTDQLDTLLGGEHRPPRKYEESEMATQTISVKPNEPDDESREHSYRRPTRSGTRSSRYGVFRSVSRAVESRYDSLEGTFNDYATAVGESVNELVEETTKDMAKGAFGL